MAAPSTLAGARFGFALRRVVLAVPVLLAIVVFNFLLVQLAPGDVAEVMAGEAGGAPPEYVAALRAELGLDQPLHVQLAKHVLRVLGLDLGYSFRHQMPVLDLILTRLGPTLLLMLASLSLAVLAGTALGVLASQGFGTWRDTAISLAALLLYAMPLFWLGLMLIVLFAINLGWMPTSGIATVGADLSGWRLALDVAHHLVLPAVTLAVFFVALYTRLMRASMLDVAGMEFVTTARAKGVRPGRITRRHVVRNAILPVVTMAGLQFGSLLGGSVIVETVFGWPGLGLLAFEALFARDLNLLLGILALSSVLVVAANILVDLLYAFLDPRIRLG